MQTTEKSLADWRDEYLTYAAKGEGLLWPNETLIRILKANYIPGLDKSYEGQRVLDIGFGNGNNLVFLASLGLEVHGTEVHQDICDVVGGKLSKLGINANLVTGLNCSLPYADDTFDMLVSWNVLHYENTESAIQEAIREYARVLKPGGRLFLSTTGPEHKILDGGRTLGGHRYEIGRDDDFRKGEVYFYFDAPNYVELYFGEAFDDVLVGRTHDHLFTETLDWWIVTGQAR